MLSRPALVRVSAIITRPCCTRMPAQYVMSCSPGDPDCHEPPGRATGRRELLVEAPARRREHDPPGRFRRRKDVPMPKSGLAPGLIRGAGRRGREHDSDAGAPGL